MAYKQNKRSRPVDQGSGDNGTSQVISLNDSKRVTIKKFKNIKLVDIRDFYLDKASGERKPGSKGIALTEDVWKSLKASMDEIDAALAALEETHAEAQPAEGRDTEEPKAKMVKKEVPGAIKVEEA